MARGLYQEATTELDKIDPCRRGHSEVLALRLAISCRGSQMKDDKIYHEHGVSIVDWDSLVVRPTGEPEPRLVITADAGSADMLQYGDRQLEAEELWILKADSTEEAVSALWDRLAPDVAVVISFTPTELRALAEAAENMIGSDPSTVAKILTPWSAVVATPEEVRKKVTRDLS